MRNTTKVHLLTYALNDKGDLVHVDEVKTGLECDCSCPACNESLIAKNKGEKRTHHFAHQSGTECKYGYESMLHLLAKCKIQQAFLKSNIFLLEYDYKSHCPNENTCHYVKYERCFTVTRKRFDLIANCMLCKNYVESYNGTGKICRLYKFLQLPQDESHDTSRAKTCPRYMFNQEEYEQVLNGQSHTPPYDEL